MMRKALALALLTTGVAVGYTLRPVPASAQTEAGTQPFTIGQTVRLYVHDFHSGTSFINCKVSAATGEFIGCEGDLRQRPARWVNLRFVQEIRPAPVGAVVPAAERLAP